MPIKPSVFEYTDYRTFLKDLYSFNKEQTNYFSYRYFSKKAGFQSPNFLKLVIDGKRNLSAKSVSIFCQALKLNSEEAQFFRNLVEFCQADTDEQKQKSAEKLSLSKTLERVYPLQKAQYRYYAKWYYVAIRELTYHQQFRSEPEWIADQFKPKLKKGEVEEAIRDLKELKLIEEDSAGILRACHNSMSTENEVSSDLIKLYHKKMMELASESIDKVERDLREISSVCVPLSLKSAQQMKAMIQKFKLELLAFAEGQNLAECVYQLNFQLFPLTRVEQVKNENAVISTPPKSESK